MVEQKKPLTKEQKQRQYEIMMAKAALKAAINAFRKQANPEIPSELQQFWDKLDRNGWQRHLDLFDRYLRTYKQVQVKQMLFDLDCHIEDCKKVISDFNRTRSEILLLLALGKISISEFLKNLNEVTNNRENLDRDIQRKIKTLNWQDKLDLETLDELTKALDNPKLKKVEMQRIDNKINQIELSIKRRKDQRNELALRLVEWKARGNIDISGSSNQGFRLDA